MGVSGSLHNNPCNYEPPPLPPPFYTGAGYTPGTSRASEAIDESSNHQGQEAQLRRSIRNEEWWQQRPSAPNISSLCHPRETLLTYAAQMTGWQSDYSTSAPSVNQEAMELTRTVSHLAAANQQLASAHSALLTQLEKLYAELNKAREEKEICKTGVLYADGSSQTELNNQLLRRIEAIENFIKKFGAGDLRCCKNLHKEKDENDKRECQKAIDRIQLMENVLEPEKYESEVERQKKIFENLKRDYDMSRSNCEKIESRLSEKEKNLEEIKRDFDSLKLETSRLTEQLDAFHMEKDTATMRIKDLESDLKKAECVREETVALKDKETCKLRATLQEEIISKKKQTEAFEEALREIQRLNDIVEGVKKTQHTDTVLDPETSMESDTNERPSLEEFKKDLSMKREARQRAIAAVSSEMDRLRRELDAEKEAHSETSRVLDLLKSQAENASRKSETSSVGTTTTEESTAATSTTGITGIKDWKNKLQEPISVHLDAERLTDVLKVSDELRACIRQQIEKIDDLRYHLECEPENNARRIETLKIIANKSREAFGKREEKINGLKNMLSQIIAGLGDDKLDIDVTDDLRTEHDRQMEDIKKLKCLYDERIRVIAELKESCSKELVDLKDKFKNLTKDKESLEEDFNKAQEKIDTQDTEISNLESQLGLTKADCRDLQNQMGVINSLFSQMLLSASSADMDLDRLTQLLQENHELISEMAREEGSEAAALPKLLLDLVEQVEGRDKSKTSDIETEKKDEDQEENIANNLPKVWRVLLELLSCHAAQGSASGTSEPASLSTDPNVCYKSVDTPTGPRLVISVSKTYIRLKELILEKKSLEKEMGRMKQLNLHLESKLGEQEKRLTMVSEELSKTWNIVGCMQAQHQQLHTHEKILRYELQQKRIMLQELKQELEYCREKWESARQKNCNTEIEWKKLRREFAARKALAVDDSFNNSAESGFSDERGDDTDDDDIPKDERLRIGSRRRTRKESPRTPTPDTESEQPTDNELSEPKSEPPSPDRQRTPTPDTIDYHEVATEEVVIEERVEELDPLDQALANVIQNLIQINNADDSEHEASDYTTACMESPDTDHTDIDVHEITSEALKIINSVSVFSIGPFPASSVSTLSLDTSNQFDNDTDSSCGITVFGTQDKLDEVPNEEVDKSVFEDEKSHELSSSVPTTSTSAPETSTLDPSTSVMSTLETSTPETSTSEITATTSELNQSKPTRTPEEVLASRAARLKRLEEQADWLMKKMSATSRRGSVLSTRLEELHEVYGEPPAPPPMPDVLPSVTLPSYLNTDQTAEPTDKTTEDTNDPAE
ncbi:cingulin-like protein 1 isoform X2 [Microplitis mediator]|uniref:cingulin-like protein 1 isoform X2 n=1 Tax=Microplitis mediator TaxID=375433 RepID=UPI0025556C77|nr:cingulin-like protein 1 isoform X2 [Microplitis mediator]